MTRHLDEMRYFISAAHPQILLEEDDLLLESIEDEQSRDKIVMIKEDINDVMFKMKSYRERNGSNDYALGVEEGLILAADMLERLLERYSQD